MGKFDGMDPKLVRQLLAEVKRAATEMRTTEGRVARLVSAAGVPSGTAHRPVQVADAADDMVRDVTSRLTLLEKKEKDQTATEPARNGQTPRDADESVVQTKDPEDKGTRSDRDGNPRTDMPPDGADKDDKGTKDETPAPKQDTPAPKDETPPPKQDTPPPRDETPPPREDTPPPKEDTPSPRDETPPPKEDTPPPQQDDPTPKEEDRDPKGDREDNPRDDRGGNTGPEGGITDPTDPEGGITDPTDPEGGITDPTDPEGGNTDPDSQDRPDTPEKDHPDDSDGPGGSRREFEVDGVRIVEQQFERPTMEELRYIIDNMENAKPLDIPSVEYGESWEGPGSPTPDGPPGQVEPSLPSSEAKSDGPVPEQSGPATDQAVHVVQPANGTVSQPDILRAAEVGTPYGSEARIGTDLPPPAGGIEYGAETLPADETSPPKEDTSPPQQDDAAPKEEKRDDSQDRPDTPEKDHPDDSDGPGGSRREFEVDGVRIVEQQFERPTMEELRYIIDNMENAKPLDIPSVEYGESWEGPGSPTPDGPPGQVEPSLPSSEAKSGPAMDQAVQPANATVSQPDTLRAAEVGTPYGSEARIGTDLPPAAGGIETGAETLPAPDETPDVVPPTDPAPDGDRGPEAAETLPAPEPAPEPAPDEAPPAVPDSNPVPGQEAGLPTPGEDAARDPDSECADPAPEQPETPRSEQPETPRAPEQGESYPAPGEASERNGQPSVTLLIGGEEGDGQARGYGA